MVFFLTGFMGCGKSYWGQKMAKQLDMPFIDLDDYIEEREKKSITEIFSKQGVQYFREIETKYLKEVSTTYAACIIATGGGTPCFNDNMQRMNKAGVTIYLKRSTDFLFNKLMNEKQKRPLLDNLEIDTLYDFIQTNLQERESFYTMSKHIIGPDSIDESIFADIISHYV